MALLLRLSTRLSKARLNLSPAKVIHFYKGVYHCCRDTSVILLEVNISDCLTHRRDVFDHTLNQCKTLTVPLNTT